MNYCVGCQFYVFDAKLKTNTCKSITGCIYTSKAKEGISFLCVNCKNKDNCPKNLIDKSKCSWRK